MTESELQLQLFSPPHGEVAQSIFSFCWSDLSDHSSTLIFNGTSYEDRQGARIEPRIWSPNDEFN